MSATISDPTAGAPPPDEPFAMFLPVTSATGALKVTWGAAPGHNFRVWVLLRDPSALTPGDLHPQHLLPHLIRVPVEPGLTELVVHVPVGRPLGVCIVGRNPEDGPQSIIPTHCADVSLDIDPAPSPTLPDAPRRTLESQAAPADTPFVLAPGSSHEAMVALAARIAATAPNPAPVLKGPTGFGLRQQWYLARLAFEPAPPLTPRVVIQRATFIGPLELNAWAETLPADAIALPAACDGLIDANTPEDGLAFFVVLQGPAPWRPILVSPASPPFESIAQPFALGDAKGRLAAIAQANAAPSPAFVDILTAAHRGLL